MVRAIVAALVAGMLVVPASASATSIVFVCSDGANLCSVDPSTRSQTQLTTDGQPGTSRVYQGPSLSRNGAKLAFVFDNQVIVSDPNAANRSAPFAGPMSAVQALMRPDGGAVAEIEQTLNAVPFEWCTYNVDGSGRDCYWGSGGMPGWAPDGGELISVNAGLPNNNEEIDHCPLVDGSCTVQVNDPANSLFDPAISPDGSTLAVIVGSATGGHVALYDYATGAFESNLTSGSGDQFPVWSPDGSQIAFERTTNGIPSIYVIGAGASPGKELELALGSEPTWGGVVPSSGGNGGRRNRGPSTRLSSPKIDRRRQRVKFMFKATGRASGFQCALVKGDAHPRYTSCHSPKTYAGLAHGTYKFYVRAFKRPGHYGPPATFAFDI